MSVGGTYIPPASPVMAMDQGSPVVATGGRGVTEMPVNEPDLHKRPVRSAMKGAKNKEMFQRQLADKLNERRLQQQMSFDAAAREDSTDSRPSTLQRGAPPTAPKPRGV